VYGLSFPPKTALNRVGVTPSQIQLGCSHLNKKYTNRHTNLHQNKYVRACTYRQAGTHAYQGLKGRLIGGGLPPPSEVEVEFQTTRSVQRSPRTTENFTPEFRKFSVRPKSSGDGDVWFPCLIGHFLRVAQRPPQHIFIFHSHIRS